MRPIPIPDECVGPGVKRLVIGPPDGDLTNDRIRPVEALAGIVDDEVRIVVLVAFEDDELERLQRMAAGHTGPGQAAVWLTMTTPQIPPFAVEVADGLG